LDYLEGAVLGGLLVHADGKLTTAATVDSRAFEAEKNGLVDRDLVHSRDLVAAGFAWVVRAVGLQGRVVKGGDIERHRGGHLHVGARDVSEAAEREGENGADAEAERHDCVRVRGVGCWCGDCCVGVGVPKKLDLLVGSF
jgi:hypothetical protein